MTLPENDIVIGLFLGDEGKGTTVDFLCSQRQTNAVIRMSGGAQAAHNVITPDGKHHTFAQLGSGSFHRVRTILAETMMVNPFSLIKEADSFWDVAGFDVLPDMLISDKSLMTTPIHAAVNKKREILRGVDRHGSTGQGIGETQNYYVNFSKDDAPIMGDLLNLNILNSKLDKLAVWAQEQVGDIWDLIPSLQAIKESYAELAKDNILNIVDNELIYAQLRNGYNVFEGSQGVLLDESFGFHPNTTWSTVTQKHAQNMLSAAGLPAGRVVGVTRTYGTRHGAGVFPSEIFTDEFIASHPEAHNKHGRFQGAWRVGLLDLELLKYASKVVKPDVLAVTHLDIPTSEVVESYKGLDGIPEHFFNRDRALQTEFVEKLAQLNIESSANIVKVDSEFELLNKIETACDSRVLIKSYGPTWKDKVQLSEN